MFNSILKPHVDVLQIFLMMDLKLNVVAKAPVLFAVIVSSMTTTNGINQIFLLFFLTNDTDQSPSITPAHSRALPRPCTKFSKDRMAAYT